jgi:hypothetical protein
MDADEAAGWFRNGSVFSFQRAEFGFRHLTLGFGRECWSIKSSVFGFLVSVQGFCTIFLIPGQK